MTPPPLSEGWLRACLVYVLNQCLLSTQASGEEATHNEWPLLRLLESSVNIDSIQADQKQIRYGPTPTLFAEKSLTSGILLNTVQYRSA